MKIHNNYFYFFIIFFLGVIIIFKFMLATIDLNCYSIGLRHEIVDFLKGRLVLKKKDILK